jgi:hypothetical protein
LDQLRGFPGVWNDPAGDDGSDDDDEGDEAPEPLTSTGGALVEDVARSFPARNAMLLVEAIADRNGEVGEDQAPDWMAHLRSLLSQVPAHLVEGWRTLRVNFLFILLSREGFAPDWKNLGEYRALIKETAIRWDLARYPALEVNQ